MKKEIEEKDIVRIIERDSIYFGREGVVEVIQVLNPDRVNFGVDFGGGDKCYFGEEELRKI